MAANKYVAIVAGKLKEVFGSVLGTANAIPAGDATGRLDLSWMPVGVGPEIIVAVASEVLANGAFVNYYTNAGVLSVRNADNTVSGKKANGFVIAPVASGAMASIYTLSQTNTQLSGLVIGTDYFLSTVGTVTAVAPTASGNISQFLGTANSSTALVFVNSNTVEIA